MIQRILFILGTIAMLIAVLARDYQSIQLRQSWNITGSHETITETSYSP